jgi:hypothetical protein
MTRFFMRRMLAPSLPIRVEGDGGRLSADQIDSVTRDPKLPESLQAGETFPRYDNAKPQYTRGLHEEKCRTQDRIRCNGPVAYCLRDKFIL